MTIQIRWERRHGYHQKWRRHLADRQDGVKFVRMNEKQSNRLFVAMLRFCQALKKPHSSRELDEIETDPKMITTIPSPTASLWQHTFVHVNIRVIIAMTQKLFYKMRFSGLLRTQDCGFSTIANRKRTPCIGYKITKAETVTIHSDIFVPLRTTSCWGDRYFST